MFVNIGLLKEDRLDFSFSGLKTAVRLAAEQIAPLAPQDVADICAGFQLAVTEVVTTRAAAALARQESRGSHWRNDFPATDAQGQRTLLTLAAADAVALPARRSAFQV